MPSTSGIISSAGSLKNPVEAASLGYRVNYISNPSFEVNISGWTSVAGASLQRATSDFNFGSASLQVTNASGSAVQTQDRILFLGGPGDYYISAYVKLAEGNTTANYFLRYLQYETNDSVSTVAAANVGIQSLSYTGQWVRLSALMPKTTNANYVNIRVVTSSTTSGDVFFVDNVMMEKSSTLKPYFDGSYNGFWTGEAHNSFSGGSPY
jgi:hypothetical protein